MSEPTKPSRIDRLTADMRTALDDFEAAYMADDEAISRFPTQLENARDILDELVALARREARDG